MATGKATPMTTSTESWGRHTSAVCKQEGVQAQHDHELWALSWSFCPSSISADNTGMINSPWKPQGTPSGSGVRGGVMMICGEVYRFWPLRLIPTSVCTICWDHKHILLSMAQPLWFFCAVLMCVGVCARTLCTLLRGIILFKCVLWCVDIFIGANDKSVMMIQSACRFK